MKSFKGFAIATALAAFALMGCATTGAPGSHDGSTRIALQLATTIAVDRVVTRDHATPADIEARASRIVGIASALKALGGDKLSTLPLIKSALAPLLDGLNLSPIERAQADLLVNALVAVGLERIDVDQYVARVDFILTEVIHAASVYIPAADPAPTS